MTALPAVARWTQERKREVVDMVFTGDATRDEACARYAISLDELAEWERSFRRCNNPAILNAVEAALSDREGRTPRQVLIRVDGFASTTVRHALAQLVADGRATFEGGDGKRRYRLMTVGERQRLTEARRVHALSMAAEEA